MSHKKTNSRKIISVKSRSRKSIRLGRQRHHARHRNHVNPVIDYDSFNGTKHSSNFQVVLEVFCFSISLLFLDRLE